MRYYYYNHYYYYFFFFFIATWVCDIWLLCTFFLRVSNVGVQGLLPVPLP